MFLLRIVQVPHDDLFALFLIFSVDALKDEHERCASLEQQVASLKDVLIERGKQLQMQKRRLQERSAEERRDLALKNASPPRLATSTRNGHAATSHSGQSTDSTSAASTPLMMSSTIATVGRGSPPRRSTSMAAINRLAQPKPNPVSAALPPPPIAEGKSPRKPLSRPPSVPVAAMSRKS